MVRGGHGGWVDALFNIYASFQTRAFFSWYEVVKFCRKITGKLSSHVPTVYKSVTLEFFSFLVTFFSVLSVFGLLPSLRCFLMLKLYSQMRNWTEDSSKYFVVIEVFILRLAMRWNLIVEFLTLQETSSLKTFENLKGGCRFWCREIPIMWSQGRLRIWPSPLQWYYFILFKK